MAGNLLSKWLSHYDPIHRGYTPRGIANAVCATNGWSFPRIKGGYNLYRGTPTSGDIDYTRPVGAAGPAASAISDFAWCSHEAGTEHFYALRAVGGGGVESSSSQPPVSVAFDDSGDFWGGRPNSPTALAVSPVSGGGFLVRWSYSAQAEEVSPTGFLVHSDGGTGTMDYEHSVGGGIVTHQRGRLHYALTTPAYDHGARRMFGVRAVSANGRGDGNVVTVEGIADAQGPDPHPNLFVEIDD